METIIVKVKPSQWARGYYWFQDQGCLIGNACRALGIELGAGRLANRLNADFMDVFALGPEVNDKCRHVREACVAGSAHCLAHNIPLLFEVEEETP